MRNLLLSATVALVISLFGTPLAIRVLVRRGYGQFIRDDGPRTHHTKRGTPTMGGAVIILATVVGYLASHLIGHVGISASGLLVLGLMVGLGLVGFLDDLTKISRQRSLGLNKRTKLAAQLLIAGLFAWGGTRFPDDEGVTPVSMHISFIRNTLIVLGPVLFTLWIFFLVSASANGVNLTDGLDGLATGACVMTFGAYTGITFWQYRNPGIYHARDPLDLSLLGVALMFACFGFLWWNASPARIFMGDTGSLALGGALAGLAICSHTEILLVVIGGLFVITTLSVIMQVISFRSTGRRIFRMSPLQHHFELLGWQEVTIVTRFWIIQGLSVALALGMFFADFITIGP